MPKRTLHTKSIDVNRKNATVKLVDRASYMSNSLDSPRIFRTRKYLRKNNLPSMTRHRDDAGERCFSHYGPEIFRTRQFSVVFLVKPANLKIGHPCLTLGNDLAPLLSKRNIDIAIKLLFLLSCPATLHYFLKN